MYVPEHLTIVHMYYCSELSLLLEFYVNRHVQPELKKQNKTKHKELQLLNQQITYLGNI